jgi:choline-sulfatase
MAALGLVACSPQTGPLGIAPGAARGQDLIIITMDTTRADHLGCYGYKPSVTPVLDRICAQSAMFADAVTVQPLTLPAHSSIMTGQYPGHHGVRYNAEYRLGADKTTLAKVLKDKGYSTAAFVSSFVLDSRFGLNQGFDVYDDRVDATTGPRFSPGHNERSARKVTDAAIEYLKHRDPGKPMFLWVHYYDAHAPYNPVDASFRNTIEQAYAGEIAEVDTQLGRLFGAAGVDLEKTALWILADHGESLGEHGERTHGMFIYDATLHVPFILRATGAGLRAQRIADEQVSLVDVMPSALSLLGVAAPGDIDGIDLIGQRRGDLDPVFAESSSPYLNYGLAPLYGGRRLGDKYILAPRPEYYDLKHDPGERDNLYKDKNPSAVEGLQRALDTHMLKIPDLTDPTQTPEPEEAETIARLQSLGYLSGGGGMPVGGALLDPKDKIEVVGIHQDAVAAAEAGDSRRALLLLHEADSIAPDTRAVVFLQAKTYLHLGMLEEAEERLERYNQLRPTADSLLLLAQILILYNEFDDANGLLDRAEQLDPQHGGVLIARGDISVARGNLEQGLDLYSRAAKLDPFRAGGAASSRIKKLQAVISTKPRQ